MYYKKESYSIEHVLQHFVHPYSISNDTEWDFDGDRIHMNSHRYWNFIVNGCTCQCCGLKGLYFTKERNHKEGRYHFNLYGLDEFGNEVMLTKDHIIPKSAGGLNHVSNYQPYCKRCNGAKGNLSPEQWKEKQKLMKMQHPA